VTLEVTPLRHGHDFHRFFLTGKSPIGKEEELMKDWQSLSHVKWDCKFHVVFVSKYRKRVMFEQLRKKIGIIIRQLCDQKGIDLHVGHAMADHIHLLLSIPPKYSVANTI
jgi:putative transposase